MLNAFRLMVIVVLAGSVPLWAAGSASPLDDAQRLFYSGEYDAAAALALAERLASGDTLAASEIRTSALHFAIQRAIGPIDSARGKSGENRDRAWKACTRCQELLSEFVNELNLGRAAARARLTRVPHDVEALFYLGKLNLNYVWLQLGTLGRRTGWSEYWEARRSLDAALAIEPDLVRPLGPAGARAAPGRCPRDRAGARPRVPGQPRADEVPVHARPAGQPINRSVTSAGDGPTIASGDTVRRDPVIVYDFNRKAGDTFRVFYSFELPAATAPPCHAPRPDIGGFVCAGDDATRETRR